MKLLAALGQMKVQRSRPDQNIEHVEKLAEDAAERRVQLLVLPEMFTTGFEWNVLPKLAERFAGDIARVAAAAARCNLWIAGSMPRVDENQCLRNSLHLFSPAGPPVVYDKLHRFSLFYEHQHVAAGDKPVIANTPWGPTGLSVCYDLRFPELYRRYALDGAVLALCPAAWPHPRLEHWRTLLRARAIENGLFMLGVNCVGPEDFGPDGVVNYCGHSAAIGPWGQTLIEATEAAGLWVAELDLSESSRVRTKMPVLRDRRPEVYGC